MASISGATLQEQLQKAISAHGVFKFKLINMVERQSSEMAPQEVADDDRCVVGAWLHGDIHPSAAGTAPYENVLELHRRFHRAAGEVASLAAERRYTEAMEAMESTSTFKRTSDQLVQAMEAWAAALESGEPIPPAVDEASPPIDTYAAAKPELEPDAPPAGWWLDPPPVPESDAETQAPVEAEAAAEADAAWTNRPTSEDSLIGDPVDYRSRPESDGLTDIHDWFGLPKSAADDRKPATQDEGRQGSDDETIG